MAPETKDNIARELVGIDQRARDCSGSATKRISNDSIAALLGNNNAHPSELGWASVDDEVRRHVLVPAPNHLTKVAGLNDSVVAGEHRVNVKR